MKNSQIFLGTTAFLLALAEALATKASHRLPIITAATKGAFGNLCKNKLQLFDTTICEGLNKAHTANGGRTLYTARVVNGVTVCGKTLCTKSE